MTLRIKLFTEKMRIAQYADNSIYDYRLKIAQAVLHFQKLPEQFTQDDIEGVPAGSGDFNPLLNHPLFMRG